MSSTRKQPKLVTFAWLDVSVDWVYSTFSASNRWGHILSVRFLAFTFLLASSSAILADDVMFVELKKVEKEFLNSMYHVNRYLQTLPTPKYKIEKVTISFSHIKEAGLDGKIEIKIPALNTGAKIGSSYANLSTTKETLVFEPAHSIPVSAQINQSIITFLQRRHDDLKSTNNQFDFVRSKMIYYEEFLIKSDANLGITFFGFGGGAKQAVKNAHSIEYHFCLTRDDGGCY